METILQLQVEKLEGILRHYQWDNDELWGMNNELEIKIKLHEIQKELKEHRISDQNMI